MTRIQGNSVVLHGETWNRTPWGFWVSGDWQMDEETLAKKLEEN